MDRRQTEGRRNIKKEREKGERKREREKERERQVRRKEGRKEGRRKYIECNQVYNIYWCVSVNCVRFCHLLCT